MVRKNRRANRHQHSTTINSPSHHTHTIRKDRFGCAPCQISYDEETHGRFFRALRIALMYQAIGKTQPSQLEESQA